MPPQGAMLDNGPPPPPGVSGASPSPPASSVGALAGKPPNGTGVDAGAKQAVLEKMMLIEKTMQDVATIMPELSTVMNSLVSQMRQKAGAIVLNSQDSGGGQQPPAGTNALSSLVQSAAAPSMTPTS